MVAHDPTGRPEDVFAHRLVEDSFVTLFWREQVLTDTLERLSRDGYQVVEVDAAGCADIDALFDLLAGALEFPDCFGGNFNALVDCLRDVVDGAYGSDPSATGLVLVLRHFDVAARIDRAAAQGIVDVYASACRDGALIGRRMMCLVQSDDPELELPPVGASSVGWNNAEWLTASRTP